MAFTNFCCRSGGSNLNAGTLTGDTTEPAITAAFTYGSGSWVQSTGVFTVASGDPAADGVAVGDFASVYPDAASVTPFVGRVTARDATTITVSSTAKAGTKPADGTSDTTLKIGGAWKGPNGSEAFPFNFVQSTLTNASGHFPRINFKNDAQYDITAAMTHGNAGPMRFEGYSSAYGDGGRATIDGGTSGASYKLLLSTVADADLAYLIFANNGASGSAHLVELQVRALAFRCVFHDSRGNGLRLEYGNAHLVMECEAYACNKSNSVTGAFLVGGQTWLLRCISHDNIGTNGNGFMIGAGTILDRCIADTNGGSGIYTTTPSRFVISGCDLYNNGGSGIIMSGTNRPLIENCNFVKNGRYGIEGYDAVARSGDIVNCGFGAGTQANTSGQLNNMDNLVQHGLVTYDDDVTPWVDPANGDFRINLAAAKGTGRGAFTQTAGSYAGAVGYPDIGAVQHQDAGGGGGTRGYASFIG
jgi:parallel beta-helix repeat protein